MGIFGGNTPLGQSEIGNWQPQQIQAQAPRVRPGFFGKGGGWRDVAGAIADAAASFGGATPSYGPAIQQQREEQEQRQRAMADYQMQRDDRFADWQAQQQWKIDHPEAPQPGEQERLIEAASQLPENDPKRQLYERAIRGYANTSEVLGAKADTQRELADYRHGLSMQLRGVPTYGQAHPQPKGPGKPGAPRVVTHGGVKYVQVDGQWMKVNN